MERPLHLNNAPKPIANLAKSTLHMNAEAVYEGPPDTNEKLSFSFKPEFQYAVLRGIGLKFGSIIPTGILV